MIAPFRSSDQDLNQVIEESSAGIADTRDLASGITMGLVTLRFCLNIAISGVFDLATRLQGLGKSQWHYGFRQVPYFFQQV